MEVTPVSDDSVCERESMFGRCLLRMCSEVTARNIEAAVAECVVPAPRP